MSKRTLLMAVIVTALLVVSIAPTAAQDPIVIRQLDNQVTQTPAWDQAIAEFEAANPGIVVEREVLSNLPEVVQFAFEGDNPPHLFAVNVLEGAQIQSLVDNGYVYSLDQFANWQEFLNTFPSPDLAVASGRNEWNDVVVSMKFDGDLFWHQWYLNLDLYEAAGLVDEAGDPIIPSTWDELVANAYAIHEATGAYGMGFPGANPFLFSLILWTCHLSSIDYGPRGFGFDMRDGQYHSADNACIDTILGDLVQMRDDGILPPDLLSIDDEPNRAMFADGDVAQIITGTWSITGWEQTHPEFTNYTSIPVPLVDVETPQHFYQSDPAGVLFAISSAAAEDPAVLDATWRWYQFIYSSALGNIWAETGNGLSIFTEGDAAQFANLHNRGYFETAEFFAPHPEPQLARRNPAIGELQQTLIGPSELDILIGVFSGQITDWHAALADLDQRNTEALAIAIADAQAAGIDISLEDFIVRDWVPSEPYPNALVPGFYPGAP
jgi:ABC-type glycerol-3-phosphate transport system substrate-binding protein